MSQYSTTAPYDTAQERCDTRCRARDTARSMSCIMTQILCYDEEGGGGGGGGSCDTARVRRHCRTRPATRPDGATTRRPAHGLGAVCAQPGFRVCTLCTRLSFDSEHCSESLFGSLFMNTVHKVFKK